MYPRHYGQTEIEVGDTVCDQYTGSCGRVVSIINDEVELEPTTIKGRARGEYLEVTEPSIRAKKANLQPDHIRRYEELTVPRLKVREEQAAYLHGESPAGGVGSEFSGGEPSPGFCCHIRDTLVKQLEDEEQGVIFYDEMSGELGIAGEDGLSNVLSHISDEEFKHYLELRGIIEILTDRCGCNRQNIKLPFS